MDDTLHSAPSVIFHDREQLWDLCHKASQGASQGEALMAVSARHLHGSLGVGWFYGLSSRVREHFPDVPLLLVLDCDEHVGHALRALRLGLAVRVRIQGDTARLRAVADCWGGTLIEDN
ncbi:MAG: hypothetical protein GDA50_01375 [Alphaproteobacteria bacterium GM202ARS2]|nr:hypothetical protein [Alphaproteobacteria bacterium GM202ARS2]